MPASPLAPTRILLIESDVHFRHERAKRLVSLGYRVSALADGEETPIHFSPKLYDVVIIDARSASEVSFGFAGPRRGSGRTPLVLILADKPFALQAPSLPAVVISEPTEAGKDEKLLAVLGSVFGPGR